MKVFGLMGLLAIALLMVSAEEKMPDGFQQWTGASLKDIGLTLKHEAEITAYEAQHPGARSEVERPGSKAQPPPGLGERHLH